jgi:hypothetical protein
MAKKMSKQKIGIYLSFSIHLLLFLSMLGKQIQAGRPLLSLVSLLTIVLMFWFIANVIGYIMTKSWVYGSIIILNIMQIFLTILLPFFLYVVFIGLDEPEFINLYLNSQNIILLALGVVLIYATSLMQ